jgi:hypothetical protein
VPAGRAVFDSCRDVHEPGHRVIEELLITFAEKTLSCVILIIPSCPVFHTATPADIEVLTNQAFVAEILFASCEGSFYAVGCEFLYRRLKDIAQSPFWLDKEFATEGVAGMFNDDEAGALLAVGTNRMFAHDVMGDK